MQLLPILAATLAFATQGIAAPLNVKYSQTFKIACDVYDSGNYNGISARYVQADGTCGPENKEPMNFWMEDNGDVKAYPVDRSNTNEVQNLKDRLMAIFDQINV